MKEILTQRSIVEVSGDDAVAFLQNLITGDLYNSNYCYSYMLSNQGRYLFDFFVFKETDTRLLIDIYTGKIKDFIARLSLYRLRSRVEIADISHRYQVIYSKNKLDNCLFSLKDPRFNKLGFRSLIQNCEDDFIQGLYLKDKYEYAIPDGAVDLSYDKSIPIEFGAEELGALSYTKGCYIGQEVISRAKYQGVVRKKIFKAIAKESWPGVISNQEIQEINAFGLPNDCVGRDESYGEVISDGKVIGKVCSSYQNLAICLLREERFNELPEKIATINHSEVIISIPDWRI